MHPRDPRRASASRASPLQEDPAAPAQSGTAQPVEFPHRGGGRSAVKMTLSRRGDYVMRSAIVLARAFPSDEPRKIREVVAQTAIPSTFASQILADLVRAGLASSRAGRDGGYRLVRPPADVTVLEVVEAAEGPLHAERCALGDGPCHWESVCPLHETWVQATAALRELLARTSLAEVAARDAAIEDGSYLLPAGDSHRARPPDVEVADRVEVEAPLAEAARRIGRLGSDLPAFAREAVCGPAPAPTASRRRRESDEPAAEATLAPIGSTRQRSATTERLYRLEWRVFAAAETARLDAQLALRPIDTERCELSISGRWQQESQRGPRRAAELEDHARRSLRTFLRRLARALDADSLGVA